MKFWCLQISQKAIQILDRFLMLGQKSVKSLVGFWGDLKTRKFHSETNWPLGLPKTCKLHSTQSMLLKIGSLDKYFVKSKRYLIRIQPRMHLRIQRGFDLLVAIISGVQRMRRKDLLAVLQNNRFRYLLLFFCS